MLYSPERDLDLFQESSAPAVTPDWRAGLPVLRGMRVVLREPRVTDATSLFALLTPDEVSRYISPPPPTVAAFERFIGWSRRMRELGTDLCFAVTVEGSDTAIGIFQLRELEPAFGSAEWGFAIGSEYWGAGIFVDAAELVVRFAFETIGVRRLEARAAVRNGRGNAALRKIGAIQEGFLRRSFLRNGEYLDQVLWSILEEDWFEQEINVACSSSIH